LPPRVTRATPVPNSAGEKINNFVADQAIRAGSHGQRGVLDPPQLTK
jgi:hypothetical protein